jgi:hypothetical protein
MTKRQPATDGTEAMRTALKSQYHGALAMLRQAIERCPDDLWFNRDYANPFWKIAYHTLFYTHLYIQPNEDSFRPWKHHRTDIQSMDAPPASAGRPPQTGEPYTKSQVLDYWNICEEMVDGAVDGLNLLDEQCGFSWYDLPKAAHQIVSIRHIQHHAAQLGVRLREASGIGIDWVGGGRQ